ncbi:N-6 DNA methylase [Vibrio breoganii]|uniref:HsdM family class I SAM-dependent methyltransferase n=2 Tax=Vibrio breoganii TaxID=553239 RepID=UPI000C832B81|nr:class I SAM-dependent DNA methyltransferase [Vibrio breoganii]PMG38601.1 N-6 DNA methylase [Vibrio breoganii]PML23438.1 N-6 DNA methylase [Vibrio breoganii]PML80266.1 N-6 DNA methylase [Vibrio breoganii]PMO99798.1 N-6 DNA methylase [Vibrio breoganii]
MVEQDFQSKTKQLIDDLKSTCARNGLGNDASEFKIITQVFLYKLLNDKFTYETKQIEPKLESSDNWEQAFIALNDDEREMLAMQLPADAAELKQEHFISTLFAKQNEADFAKLFDDTLRDISMLNSDTFSVMTDSGEKVALFESISEYVTVSKRDDFCRAIINSIAEFSFERIFTQKYDFYAVIFEYLIKDYNSNSGGKYAEYYTPHAVARIMASILVPEDQQGKVSNVSCYDPSAGSGTLLMNVAHAIGESRCSIFTQDISKKSSNLLRLNLILNNLVHSIPNVIEGDTMRHPHHKDGAALKQFDYIVSNPPFKLDFSEIHEELNGKEHQKRFFAGVPKVPAKAKDKMAIYQLFLQHIIYSLKPGGKAAVVLPTGFITAQSGIDKKIRQHLVDNKMLAGVVSMPSNIFATTGTNVSILFIDDSNKDRVVLIDASNLGQKVKEGKNQKTVLEPEEEQQIIEVFNKKTDKEDFSITVSYEDITENNYSLSAGQYFEVKIDHIDITAEQFIDKMQGFNYRLDSLFKNSHEFEVQVKEQLSGLKYDCK